MPACDLRIDFGAHFGDSVASNSGTEPSDARISGDPVLCQYQLRDVRYLRCPERRSEQYARISAIAATIPQSVLVMLNGDSTTLENGKVRALTNISVTKSIVLVAQILGLVSTI